MSLYGGIDLHANNSVIVLINEQDEVIYRKRLPNALPTILEQLAPYHMQIKGLVVESTYNWYWLVDGFWLAHLLRLGVLPEGYIYPKAERAVRDLLRKRAHLVRQHTSNVLSVQNILVRNTGARFSVKRLQELTKQELKSLLAEEPQVLAVTSSLTVLDCLRQQIKTLEKTVHKRLHHTPAYEQLLTVDGIGTILAQTITLETGAISRFPTVGNYASYCRCVDSTKISNGKRKGTGNVKNGNPYLAWAYMEAAQFAMRFQPAAQRFYQRKLAQSRNNTVLARKAVAHKLSRACYYIMRDLVPFEAAKAFG